MHMQPSIGGSSILFNFFTLLFLLRTLFLLHNQQIHGHKLSLSFDGGMLDYYQDSVAIGACTAMEKKVLISCSSQYNTSPNSNTLSNVTLWIIIVGVGTLDLDFPTYFLSARTTPVSNYTQATMSSERVHCQRNWRYQEALHVYQRSRLGEIKN